MVQKEKILGIIDFVDGCDIKMISLGYLVINHVIVPLKSHCDRYIFLVELFLG